MLCKFVSWEIFLLVNYNVFINQIRRKWRRGAAGRRCDGMDSRSGRCLNPERSAVLLRLKATGEMMRAGVCVQREISHVTLIIWAPNKLLLLYDTWGDVLQKWPMTSCYALEVKFYVRTSFSSWLILHPWIWILILSECHKMYFIKKPGM